MVIDNTALRTTSQATGDVAASEGQCESKRDYMIWKYRDFAKKQAKRFQRRLIEIIEGQEE